MSSPDSAQLLQRLLEDPDFRARFERDPAATARGAGFESLARGIDADPERVFETLELRESRSSAAGFMIAAAVEGLGLFELSEHVLPHLGADDALAADRSPPPPQHAAVSLPVDADDLGDAGGDDDDDDDETDENEPDENEPDENEPDENEPDENEPDENEPDENEPDDNEPDENEPDGNEPDENEPDDNDGADDGAGDDDQSGDSGSDDSEPDDNDGADDGAGDDGGDDDPELPPVPDGYPGDSAPQPQLAAWMGHEAVKRGLPAELPVMAALVESGMANLPGGDADSVGFFQMRLGIWNQGDYAGYPDRPELQLDWFLDHAEAVKAQRLARGQPIDEDHYGDWVADVERPAAQYRGRYALQLDDARELLRRRFPDGHGLDDAPPVDSGSAVRAGPRAREAVAVARKFLGLPYRWGGSSPSTGFDCSGLVQWAYAKAGISIPRVTDQQILAPGATKVGRNHLLPGDLVFFRDSTGYVHHVGMSLGGDRFIESPRTGLEVRISSLKDPYYAAQFTGGRRFDAAVPAVDVRARVMPVLTPDQLGLGSG